MVLASATTSGKKLTKRKKKKITVINKSNQENKGEAATDTKVFALPAIADNFNLVVSITVGTAEQTS